MPSKIPMTGIRIIEPTYSKIRYIAKINKRSMSKEIEHLCEEYIAAYEAEHGPIQLPAAPETADQEGSDNK